MGWTFGQHTEVRHLSCNLYSFKFFLIQVISVFFVGRKFYEAKLEGNCKIFLRRLFWTAAIQLLHFGFAVVVGVSWIILGEQNFFYLVFFFLLFFVDFQNQVFCIFWRFVFIFFFLFCFCSFFIIDLKECLMLNGNDVFLVAEHCLEVFVCFYVSDILTLCIS